MLSFSGALRLMDFAKMAGNKNTLKGIRVTLIKISGNPY